MKKLLIAFLLLTTANAGAMQNIKLGTLEINPQVSVQQSYDSNIYLTRTKPLSANINRTGLGVNLLNKIGSRLDLKGAYTAEFLSYSRSTNINNATHHLASLGVEARLPKSTTFILDDKYMQTTDQATSELTARALRVQNTAGAGLEAPLRGKFGFNLAAQHTYHNYLAAVNNLLDRQEMLSGADLTFKVQPKTKLVLGFRYGTMSYKLASADNGDAFYNNWDLGLTGNIAPKLVGTIKAGVQYRRYEKSLNQAADKINTGGYSAQLLWKPAELTEVILYGKRGNVETSYGDNRFYTSNTGDITLSRQVHKLKAGLGFNYEAIAYPEITALTGKKRLDTNTNMRATAEYDMRKWLKAGVGYMYKNRTTNEKDFKYHDNIVSVELKGMF
ncbi:MAG: hypothetical protein A2021_04270 [Elusimicrobia bacterium GWF2_52_66]|nr:MAG: hypothetical protein A2X33_04095 [Elusimicrobia bacterium GWA2_51_34]OGR85934.1 MAG: hypothetical protein A2021_04270 [Elusimicrobia bacterium GWF2_52_66]HAF96510.1 hypothetical protein [Elusimicrobiota bacterium]HCE97589.1 hypothetical protein [Elusimicrobiota bacterium]